MTMKPKHGEIRIDWSKRENDLVFSWGGEGATKATAGYLQGQLSYKHYDCNGRLTEPSIIEELEARGYDITTLHISIKKKPQADETTRA